MIEKDGILFEDERLANYWVFMNKSDKEKIKILEKNGWEEYYGKSMIRKEWVEKNLPYDRMAMNLDHACKVYLKEHPWVLQSG